MTQVSEYISPDLQNIFVEQFELVKNKKTDNKKQKLVLIILWSKSDIPKIQEDVLNKLKEEQIPYVIKTLSGHRNADELFKVIKSLPNLYISDELTKSLDEENKQLLKETISKFEVVSVVTAAGMSAHIGWVAAAASKWAYPIWFFPISSTIWWGYNRNQDNKNREAPVATESGGDMPPWVPTWLLATQKSVVSMIKRLYNLELDSNFTNIELDDKLKNNQDILKLLDEFWLTVWESPICINTQNIEVEEDLEKVNEKYKNKIPITIATVDEPFRWDNMKKKENLNRDGFYMWYSKNDNIRPSDTINAIMFSAQIIGRFNPQIKKKAELYFEKKAKKTFDDNTSLEKEQFVF